MGACNAAKYNKEQAITKARLARLREEANAPADLSDINEYYDKHGGGTHFLEYDFTPDTEEKQYYISKTTGLEKSFWCWTHKYTEYSVKRYGSANGKYIDSGRLSKYLALIPERQYPEAYARAQRILFLNDPLAANSKEKAEVDPLAREELLKQQVRPMIDHRLSYYCLYLAHYLPSSFFDGLGESCSVYCGGQPSSHLSPRCVCQEFFWIPG
jgi:hypothetical protein